MSPPPELRAGPPAQSAYRAGTLQPRPETMLELAQVRKAELEAIRDRMARLETGTKGAWLAPLGFVLLGAPLGASIAAIPIFGSATASYPAWVEPVYWGISALIGGVALICFAARRAVRSQQVDSLAGVRAELDGILARYPSGEASD